jgi:hypothetical protein
MSIRIKLKMIRKNEDDIVSIEVKTMYGIINVKFEVPLLDIVFVNNKIALKYKAEIESNKTSRVWKRISKIFSVDDFNNLKKYFHHDPELLHKLKNYWFDKLAIYDFSFILKYGLSDAALAAILYGFAWTVLGPLLALAKNNLNFTIKDIIIKPFFDRETFNVEFSCIIKFKFGDIINTGIMVLRRRAQRKRVKHGLKEKLNAS